MWLQKREGEALALSYKLNVGILNVLWSVTCGRKLHAQQQEFQSVYECIDKITQVKTYSCNFNQTILFQFMSRAAIFSFLPILTKILPESITNIERGRYYRWVMQKCRYWLGYNEFKGIGSMRSLRSGLESTDKNTEVTELEIFRMPTWRRSTVERSISHQRTWLQLSGRYLSLELSQSLWWWGGLSDCCLATQLSKRGSRRRLIRLLLHCYIDNWCPSYFVSLRLLDRAKK